MILAGILQDDLESYLGTSLDDGQAGAVLNAASAACRSYTGQLLDYVTNDVVVLDVERTNDSSHRHFERLRGSAVLLPQLPVVAVSQVLISGQTFSSAPLVADVDYTLSSDGELRVFRYGWSERLQITYTHGYQTIPDDIKFGAVLPYAARMLNNPSGQVGRTRDTVIDMYAPATVGFFPNEQAILDQFRVLVVA